MPPTFLFAYVSLYVVPWASAVAQDALELFDWAARHASDRAACPH